MRDDTYDDLTRWLEVIPCDHLPPGVCVFGELIAYNVEEMSPKWVNDLAGGTKSERKLLRKIIEGLLKGDEEDVREAIEEDRSNVLIFPGRELSG